METMMDSANARKLVNDIFESLSTHRRSVIDEKDHSLGFE